MKARPYFLSGPAQQDIVEIRRYSIHKWGSTHWLAYKKALQARMQRIANNPTIGLLIPEFGEKAFRFPDNNHVFYYLERPEGVLFVGILSHSIAPEKHLKRLQDIDNNT